MTIKSKKLAIRLTQGTKGSQSTKRLAEALTEKLGYKVYRTLKESSRQVQIKYGHGVDKIAQYEFFKAHSIPALEFTTDMNVAEDWCHSGHTVVGRSLLNSSCGKGIVLMGEDYVDTGMLELPVYTKYKKKKREFRVHVFKDTVVCVMEKKLRSDWNGPRESKIRNLANGYVFCSCDNPPEGIDSLAIKAAGVCQSDFKGVDIGFNEKANELFVIEVNSAPGMEGSRIPAYVNAIVSTL